MKKDWNARLVEISATDREIWQTGRMFAGIDEAGRGPLSGPVAAACVVMPKEPLLLYVDDYIALGTRMLDRKGRQFGLFVSDGSASFRQIRLWE